MLIKAVGAGNYGSVPGTSAGSVASRPAAGNSKLFPAKSAATLGAVARQQTQEFISNARQVARGASGISRISIRV